MSKFSRSITIKTAAYLAAVGLFGVLSLGSAQSDETFSQTAAVLIPGSPLVSFDISWVDPNLRRYFLADRSNKAIDVINYTSGNTVTQLTATPPFAGFSAALGNDFAGPNGVLTFKNPANGINEIWAGDGPTSACNSTTVTSAPADCSTVKVINFDTGATTHVIPTGGQRRADELCYDSTDHVIMIANDAEADVGNPPFVSFIPTQGPNAYTVVKKLAFPEATNGIEQCQWNSRTGLIYLNLPEVNGNGNDTKPGRVEVIDPVQMVVVRFFTIPLPKCAGPQGMAIGPAPQILLGCNARGTPENGRDDTGAKFGTGAFNSAIIDEKAGNVIAVLNDLGGADEVWFNPGDQHYSLALGSHLPNEELGIVDSSNFDVDQTIVTGSANGTTRRAHSVAAEPVGNLIFLPVPGSINSAFTSPLCPNFGVAETQGCVAIFTPSGNDADDAPKAAFVRRHGGEH